MVPGSAHWYETKAAAPGPPPNHLQPYQFSAARMMQILMHDHRPVDRPPPSSAVLTLTPNHEIATHTHAPRHLSQLLASFYPAPSHIFRKLIFLLVSSCLVFLFHLVSSRFGSFRLLCFRPVLSRPIPYHPIPSHPIPFYPSHPIPPHIILSHLILCHSISPLSIPSHFIPSHLTPSLPSHPNPSYPSHLILPTPTLSHPI